MAFNELKKADPEEVTNKILLEMPARLLAEFARLHSNPLSQEAFNYYIAQREIAIARQMRIDYRPETKNWNTLFSLQDLQSRLTELVRLPDIFLKANKLLLQKKK